MGEYPNFPLFIAEDDSDAAFEHYNPRDSAFDLLFELVLRAVLDFRRAPEESNSSKPIRRLYSIVVPVGTAQFWRDNSLIDNEPSRLYNRYSSVLLVFRLDITAKTMGSQIQQVQRYSDFRVADWKSCHATIRAMMHFVIAIVKAGLELKDVMQRLSSINAAWSSTSNKRIKPSKSILPIRVPKGNAPKSSFLRSCLLGGPFYSSVLQFAEPLHKYIPRSIIFAS